MCIPGAVVDSLQDTCGDIIADIGQKLRFNKGPFIGLGRIYEADGQLVFCREAVIMHFLHAFDAVPGGPGYVLQHLRIFVLTDQGPVIHHAIGVFIVFNREIVRQAFGQLFENCAVFVHVPGLALGAETGGIFHVRAA